MNRLSERAQAAVEMAVIAPAFLMLLLGIFEAGVTYNHKLTLAQSTRDGARKAIVSRNLTSGGIILAAQTAVKTTADATLDLTKLQIDVTAGDNPEKSNGVLWEQGDTITVRTRYPWRVKIIGVSLLSGTLDESTTLRME